MRIGLVTPEYVTEPSRDGGLAGYLHRTARTLYELGHEPVVIVSADRNAHLFHEGVEVWRVCVENPMVNLFDRILLPWLPIKWLWRSWLLNRTAARLESQQPFDVLQYASYTGTAFFRRSRTPAVVRLSSLQGLLHRHNGLPRNLSARLLEWMDRRALARADALFSPSMLVSREVQAMTGRPVAVIESPADMPQSGNVVGALPAELTGRPYLFYFGTLSELKGLDVLADALPRLLGDLPELLVVMAGKQQAFRGEAMVNYILQRAGTHADRVNYLGVLSRNELLPLLQQAAAVVLPSRVDNLPNACIEAMGAGTLVVASRDASFEQLIEDGENGFLFTNGDPADLARVVGAALELDEAEKRSMARKARLTIQRLEPRKVVAELVDFYRTRT